MLPFDPSTLYFWQIGAGLVAVVAGWGIWKSTGLFSGGGFTGVSSVPKVGEMIRRKSLAPTPGSEGGKGKDEDLKVSEMLPKQRKMSFAGRFVKMLETIAF
jgi:hypothetical protein